ncbi:ankyrin repeat domain-containing protein 29-like [Haliotis asinina]|uniref:ankyrin repeat domain-containing protein 29-like n=1 Tax=Haliotis asinina TaxID=109174 RepID=UPI003531BF94
MANLAAKAALNKSVAPLLLPYSVIRPHILGTRGEPPPRGGCWVTLSARKPPVVDPGAYLVHQPVGHEKQNDPEKSPLKEVDKQDTFANSSLHEACKKGDMDRVRHILTHGLMDINSRDENGRTALMMAAQGGHCEMFEFLIRKGANKSEVDEDCRDALHWACKGGHEGMVDCLLPQYGIMRNIYIPPLIEAAGRGNMDLVEFLLCMGSNVSHVDRLGGNALHRACTGGHIAVVKYLFSQGSVDINCKRRDGMTPLMVAASKGHTDIFGVLVSMGANASHVNNYGYNILHLASAHGHMEMVKYILSKNLADINAREKGGRTAAMIAKHKKRHNVYNFLVSEGCPVK